MELGGSWRAAVADEALRRAFPAPDFADDDWAPISVPGHWRSNDAFADSDGPALYRTRFGAPRPDTDRRAWLTLDGVFYDGDVWLDGSYVGATEGYFFPHTFEVTDTLTHTEQHVLAVEVACSPPGDRSAKRALTGEFQHSDSLDPTWNPGGIWLPVHLTETGAVRMARLRVLCPEATPERALVNVRAVLDAVSAVTALIRVTVSYEDVVVTEQITRHTLAKGENRIRLGIVVESPNLWWPHALGSQPLYDVTVDVLTPLEASAPARRRSRSRDEPISDDDLAAHVRSDGRRVRTGLRQVRMNHWIVTVNGERLFLKGSNQGPNRMALGEATANELERDVVLAKEAGLDLLRIRGHVSRAEVYDAADRHGMLLWQDLPLQWGYARTVRKQAIRQAREAVDLLGHHPSIALWCGHNEPASPRGVDDNSLTRVAALQAMPTWNKTVLDASIARALERADASRPVVAHSGMWPGPITGGTDSHLFFGWHHGTERDFPRILATVPNLARFVTEFGTQAVPPSAEFMDPSRWPDLDWDDLAQHHAMQIASFEKYVPPGDYKTFDEWQDATQAYQASVIRYHIETLRRLKYRPTGGFCHFFFADGIPAVSASVLDHTRREKAGYAALAAACAPVIVVADRPRESYPRGSEIALDVHVVSDLRRPLAGAKVVATLGAERWGWDGDLPADACARVGTVQATARSSLELVLTLAAGDVVAVATYDITVDDG